MGLESSFRKDLAQKSKMPRRKVEAKYWISQNVRVNTGRKEVSTFKKNKVRNQQTKGSVFC